MPQIKVLVGDKYYVVGGSGSSQEAIDYADKLKEQTDSAISALQSELESTDDYIDGAFKDSIISAIESEKISGYIKALDSDKYKLDAQYSEVYANPELTQTNKDALFTVKSNYDDSYNTLVESINLAILDSSITPEEDADYESKYLDYFNDLSVLSSVLQLCVDAISLERTGIATDYVDGLVDPLVERVETVEGAIVTTNEEVSSKLSKSVYDVDVSEIRTDISDLEGDLADTQEYIDGSFKDGIIYDAEFRKIQSYLNTLGISKADFDNQYLEVYNSVHLEGTPKTNLNSAKTDYDEKYTALVSKINSVISDREVTTLESDEVDTAFTQYNGSIAVLSSTLSIAVDSIAKSMADEAQFNAEQYAKGLNDAVVEDISGISQELESLDTYVDGSFKDGIIEQAEAKAIEKYINSLTTEKSDIDSKYLEIYGMVELTGVPKTSLATAKTNYDSAHTALINSINTAITDGKTTVTEKADVDTKFSTYSDTVSVLALRFETAISTIAQAKATKAENNAKEHTNGLVSTINSEIEQLSESISLRVTKTVYEQGIEDTEAYVREYSEKKRIESPTAPTDTEVIWIDTSNPDNVIWKVWNGTEWLPGPSGPQGPQGIQGPSGEDGQTLYTWVRYADSPTSGMSNLPDGKEYIGLSYNNTTPTESSSYGDYTWSLIKGEKGVPGDDGTDGVTTYTWVKYADDENGAGMSDSPDGKRYLGLAYNKTTATESNTASHYSWSTLYETVYTVDGGKVFAYPDGGSINIRTSNVIGILAIKTPIKYSYMTKIRISGYNYVSNKTSIDLEVSFYAYTNGILQHSYVNRGDFIVDRVRVGRDSSGNAVIFLGNSTTNWDYPAVQVESATLSFQTPPDSYKTGWSMSFITDLTPYTNMTELGGTEYRKEINSVVSRVSTAEQKITDSAIVSTVTQSTTYTNDLSGKVSTNQVISSINQTAESIKIQASKITLQGAVTVLSDITGNLGTINAGTINGVTINGSVFNASYAAVDPSTPYGNTRLVEDGLYFTDSSDSGEMYGNFYSETIHNSEGMDFYWRQGGIGYTSGKVNHHGIEYDGTMAGGYNDWGYMYMGRERGSYGSTYGMRGADIEAQGDIDIFSRSGDIWLAKNGLATHLGGALYIENNYISPQVHAFASLMNGWENYSSASDGFQQARYTKMPSRMVYLSGLIRNGIIQQGTPVFILPVGCRPGSTEIFIVRCGGYGEGQVYVYTNGEVTVVQADSNSWISLSGITFRAEG